MNHWFEPIEERGIGPSNPADDPSCTGVFQFLGSVPTTANLQGELRVHDLVDQLAPHIWVVDFARFLEVTGDGARAPDGPDAFVTGGLLIPFEDILDQEASFIGTEPLTNCEPDG